jgi:hypothetical protein
MRRTLAVAACVLTLAGCSSGSGSGSAKPAKPPAPLALSWQAVTLPAPPGPTGRLAVRDAVACDGKWYVVGAVLGPGDASRPAAWSSADGRTWHAMNPQPSSFYGKLQTFYTAACKDGVLATIGAKSGGAHGNPRISTFYSNGDTLVEVSAAFTLYGGSEQVNLGRLSVGPKGWLIAGNRVTGAAAWLSPDAKTFEIVEKAPGLASDAGLDTLAEDGYVAADGYTLVGGGLPHGRLDHDPFVWTSPDGHAWTRVALPHDDQYEDLQLVVAVGDQLVALGLHGEGFSAWYGKGGSWQVGGRFSEGGSPLGGIRSATVAGSTVYVSAQNGKQYGIWASTDIGRTWQTVTMPPGAHPAGSEKGVAVAAAGKTLLVAADDGAQSKLWIAGL